MSKDFEVFNPKEIAQKIAERYEGCGITLSEVQGIVGDLAEDATVLLFIESLAEGQIRKQIASKTNGNGDIS